MLRNEVQKLTGLTRKAIEYYEEKGLIVPWKNESGYREYTEEDIRKLNKIAVLENNETILNRLTNAFPGYFGYMFFAAYRPFFNEPVKPENESAYLEYVKFLDELPPFNLSDEERAYVEKLAVNYDLETMQKINLSKIQAIEQIDEWMEENKEFIQQYEAFKNSDEYQNSIMKKIQDKLQQYMIETHYYERAIPLIRAFSESYNDYYQKLIAADEKYLKS